MNTRSIKSAMGVYVKFVRVNYDVPTIPSMRIVYTFLTT